MNKPNHLGLAGLELSKILISELFYGYVKSKYDEKVKLFCMDRDKKKASHKKNLNLKIIKTV